MASAYHDDLRSVFEEEILLVPSHEGSAALLVALADRGIDWAISLAEGPLKESVDRILSDPVDNHGFRRIGEWQWHAIRRLLPFVGTSGLSTLMFAPPKGTELLKKMMGMKPLTVRFLKEGRPTPLAFQVNRVSPFDEAPPADLMSASAWLPVAAAIRFLGDPSCENLAASIRSLAMLESEERNMVVYRYAAWPIISIISRHGASGSDWDELANQAEAGAFGTAEDWKRAEERWSGQGVTSEDFEMFESKAIRPGSYLADLGFPFTAARPENGHRAVDGQASTLLV